MSARLIPGLHALARRHARVYGSPRGAGLLAGVPVLAPNDAASIVQHAREVSHVLVNKAAGNTIRLAPPLIIDAAGIDRALDALDKAAETLVKPAENSTELLPR
jgi:acetylornithine/succinyldiaminopimelate/putrescine aminotransferase